MSSLWYFVHKANEVRDKYCDYFHRPKIGTSQVKLAELIIIKKKFSVDMIRCLAVVHVTGKVDRDR